MPNVPGDVVLEEARQRNGTYQVSMLTAVEPDGDVLDLPYDDYLVKPVTKAEVTDVVERLVLRHSLERDLRELFRLTAKRSTLRTRFGDGVEQAQATLDAEIRSKRDTLNAKLQELEEPEDVFSLVDGNL